MTDFERLKLVNAVLDSDLAHDVETGMLDCDPETIGKASRLVARLYRLVHPRFGICNHPDWEQENEELLKTYGRDIEMCNQIK